MRRHCTPRDAWAQFADSSLSLLYHNLSPVAEIFDKSRVALLQPAKLARQRVSRLVGDVDNSRVVIKAGGARDLFGAVAAHEARNAAASARGHAEKSQCAVQNEHYIVDYAKMFRCYITPYIYENS